ncbi:MAG TPA: amidohydrolase family protein [Pseudomonadales bacterium]|nr:amidohydrolase family protein [Pseudomonadales bacterium]
MDQATWLAQVNEPVLEPELPICDPHHHLWDFPNSRYLLDELLLDTGSGHNVVSTVFVECGSMYRADGPAPLKCVGETEFVNGIAAMSASGGYGAIRACKGIVGLADLNLGERVGAVLDAHMAVGDRFKGIRHAAGWDASDQVRKSHTNPTRGMLLDKTFRQGFRELGKRGLSFDAWLYHPQIPELTDLARAFPDTTIILDHFGGPLGIGPYEGKGAEVFALWKRSITELAKCPNVVAKLGGIAMPINGFGFHKRERPATSDELVAAGGDYYRHAIDCFGPERCMFESNFPVDKASCSYRTLWNAFKKIAAGASNTEKAALFHDTAVRVYRL